MADDIEGPWERSETHGPRWRLFGSMFCCSRPEELSGLKFVWGTWCLRGICVAFAWYARGVCVVSISASAVSLFILGSISPDLACARCRAEIWFLVKMYFPPVGDRVFQGFPDTHSCSMGAGCGFMAATRWFYRAPETEVWIYGGSE